jgi:hypothetical protein
MIAWFIMLHQNPEQFDWLLRAIYNPDDIFLVHVDLKSLFNYKGRGGTYSRVKSLVAGKPNIRLMRPRSTNWGGWSLGRISLDAIDILLDADRDWTHFINLSGECYPIKPLPRIRATLRDDAGAIYVETKAFADLPPGDWHPRRPRVLETPLKIVILPGRRQPPRGFSIEHKGSQWVILPRDFCAWQRQAPFRRDMDRYMRFSPLSDELVMQTLLLNGPFRERQASHYGRAIRLVEPAPHPAVLTMQDLGFLQNSGAMFARKFDARVDAGILHWLAGEIGRK